MSIIAELKEIYVGHLNLNFSLTCLLEIMFFEYFIRSLVGRTLPVAQGIDSVVYRQLKNK